nr:hypothetical protein CFP56_36174 [Quercus suber]
MRGAVDALEVLRGGIEEVRIDERPTRSKGRELTIEGFHDRINHWMSRLRTKICIVRFPTSLRTWNSSLNVRGRLKAMAGCSSEHERPVHQPKRLPYIMISLAGWTSRPPTVHWNR